MSDADRAGGCSRRQPPPRHQRAGRLRGRTGDVREPRDVAHVECRARPQPVVHRLVEPQHGLGRPRGGVESHRRPERSGPVARDPRVVGGVLVLRLHPGRGDNAGGVEVQRPGERHRRQHLRQGHEAAGQMGPATEPADEPGGQRADNQRAAQEHQPAEQALSDQVRVHGEARSSLIGSDVGWTRPWDRLATTPVALARDPCQWCQTPLRGAGAQRSLTTRVRTI